MAKVTVVAEMKAKQGLEDGLKRELLALVKPSRGDAGCLNYDLHQSAEDPTLFLFYENWASAEDLEAHRKTPHLEALPGRIGELLAEPVKVTIWNMLSTPA